MPRKKKCSIVIPLYKEYNLSKESELASLKQVSQILGRYPITLIHPENLNLEPFIQIIQRAGATNVKNESFDRKYFVNIAGYNSLLLSTEFYKRFSAYQYILIYQLDAWVFRDELEYWCNKGYDYIGAPWFEGMHNATTNSKFIGVGNGGFSLRRVKTHSKILKRVNALSVLEEYCLFNWKGLISRLPRFFHALNHSLNNHNLNRNESFEDVFLCVNLKNRINDFRAKTYLIRFLKKVLVAESYNISPYGVALKFSFETNPSKLFKENGNQLPFGCHAWERYESEFWKQFIKI